MRPFSIVLHFNGTHWNYNTFGPNRETLNLGSGYDTALLALTQAQIFTSALPDETIVVLSAFPIATSNERKADGETND